MALFETPVPVLAKGKTDTGRAWVYARDDRPFGGPDPPAALFRYWAQTARARIYGSTTDEW